MVYYEFNCKFSRLINILKYSDKKKASEEFFMDFGESIKKKLEKIIKLPLSQFLKYYCKCIIKKQEVVKEEPNYRKINTIEEEEILKPKEWN